jgi:hypothetical protein
MVSMHQDGNGWSGKALLGHQCINSTAQTDAHTAAEQATVNPALQQVSLQAHSQQCSPHAFLLVARLPMVMRSPEVSVVQLTLIGVLGPVYLPPSQ